MGTSASSAAGAEPYSFPTAPPELLAKVKGEYDKALDKGKESGTIILSNLNIEDIVMPELCNWITKIDEPIRRIDLSENRLTSRGAALLFNTLRESSSKIQEISLRLVPIDDTCMQSLGEYIKSNKSIERVVISGSNITDKGIKILQPCVDGNVTFKCLDVSECKLMTEKSLPFFMKMLQSSHIEDIVIGFESNLVVLIALNQIKYGKDKLILSHRNIEDSSLIEICEEITKYSLNNIKSIDFSFNNVTSKGASVLFDTLKQSNSVATYVDLRKNLINDDCVKNLGEYIQQNPYLEKIILENNRMTNNGMSLLPEYIAGNTTLKEMNFRLMGAITDKSLPYFQEIAKTSCVTDISFGGIYMPYIREQDLINLLRIPPEQREIPIKSNTKSASKSSIL